MLHIAQELPDPKLLQGGAQEVLAWVVLAVVALYVATVVYFIRRQGRLEEKYDDLQAKTIKQIMRSNRAMEAVANLPPPEDHDE